MHSLCRFCVYSHHCEPHSSRKHALEGRRIIGLRKKKSKRKFAMGFEPMIFAEPRPESDMLPLHHANKSTQEHGHNLMFLSCGKNNCGVGSPFHSTSWMERGSIIINNIRPNQRGITIPRHLIVGFDALSDTYIMSFDYIRKLVSGNKARFVDPEAAVNLDLVYGKFSQVV